MDFNIFSTIDSIIAATAQYDGRTHVSRYKQLTDEECLTLLASSDYSDAVKNAKRSVYIYRGDVSITSQYPLLITPGIRVSENTSNVYTFLMSTFLPSWRDYPKRNRSFVCTNSLYKAELYAYDDDSVFCLFPKNNTKIGVCLEADIWDSFINLSVLGICDANDFNLQFIDFMSSVLNTSHDQIESWFKNYNNTGLIFNKFATIEQRVKQHASDYSRVKNSLYKHFVDGIVNKNLSIIEILDKLLDPKKNGFKLLNGPKGVYNLTKNENWRELWLSGEVLMINKYKMNTFGFEPVNLKNSEYFVDF